MTARRFLPALSLITVLSGCASQYVPRGVSPKVVAVRQEPSHPSSRNGVREGPNAYDSRQSLAESQEPGSDWPAPVHDDQRFTFLRAEQLEYRLRDTGQDVARWEAQGWHGGDYQRLWLKTEGEQSIEGTSEGEAEVQALYSRLIAPFWDFQVGARYDKRWGPGPDRDRWFGVVGVQGFSPYEFETELALFVSEDADVSARLTATTDFLITQRLILQPRFETEIAAQKVPEFQVGQGVNYADLGMRLRYEFKREFAPYVGVNWIRNLGETEDLIRGDGGHATDLALVFGVSIWF